MSIESYTPLTISGLREKYASGATPREIIGEIIERAKTPSLAAKNIWITPPSRELIEPYLAALPARDYDKYPLWGVPFAIKDNIDLAGVPTTAACPDFAYTPSASATVVERLIAAGAIPVGKTNLDQFATGLVGQRSPYGAGHNAYDDALISGGSSAGSAVCVAAGLAAFALGTDTAGSGRVPAMLHSLIGLKPALGAWSTRGVVPACASLDAVTVFAQSLADARVVDAVARGFDAECAYSRELPLGADALPEKIFLPEPSELTFFGVAPEVHRAKWEQAASRIKKLGVPVEVISIKSILAVAKLLYDGSFVAERWSDLGDFVDGHPGSTHPVTEQVLRSGARTEYSAARLFRDLHALQADRQRVHELLRGAVLILPTAGGTFTREQVAAAPIATNSQMGLYTNHCNLLDLAAIDVPEDSCDHELPLGITIFARHDAENLVMGTAAAFLARE